MLSSGMPLLAPCSLRSTERDPRRVNAERSAPCAQEAELRVYPAGGAGGATCKRGFSF